jgi:chromosome segregation ATPase
MLKEELHEAMQNLRTMSVQYNNLETKAQIQLETQKETRKKLEQCNSYIQKLQKELQVLRLAEKAATQNARKVEEHKEHVQDLLEENSRLEENLSKLCELPFVQDESTASVDPLLEEQITELECSNARYREQIQELIEGKLDYEEQFVSVRDENKRWREQCEELQSEAEVYRSRRKTNMEDAFTQTIIFVPFEVVNILKNSRLFFKQRLSNFQSIYKFTYL